jgi:uncharacterized protein
VAAPLLAAVLAVAVLAGCSTPATPRFHSLLERPDAAPAPATPAGTRSGPAIDLATVTVPTSVDQPQWVLRMPDGSLRVLEQERWIAPVRDELRAALFERWAQRLDAVDARLQPARGAWQVTVDVSRFESVPGQGVWLEANWSVRAAEPRAGSPACSSRLHEATGGDVAALAAAHRRAVVRLADLIAARMASPEAPCPG